MGFSLIEISEAENKFTSEAKISMEEFMKTLKI